jgi:trans-aconitate methyltransferase
MVRGMRTHDPLLAEQIAYYRARAPEYSDGVIPGAIGGGELEAALDAFHPAGDVLELACGPGTWTAQLLRHADSLTAVDASPEMLAIASSQVPGERVRFVLADLFAWRPERRYDVVFFGFWLSHVPPERFEAFWSLVADCLAPGGRVFFADDGYRTPDELIEGESSSTIRRRLNDGTAYRAVKVPYEPAELEDRLERLGWQITVTQTSGPFYWGAGSRLGLFA